MSNRLEIIAEISQGYQGDPNLSELLAKGAISANADSIKFQMVFADELCTPDYKHYSLFKSHEMEESVWKRLCRIIQENGKKAYFDIFGMQGLSLAKTIGADGVKISTTEFFHEELFTSSLENFSTVLLSVGGINELEIERKVSSIPTQYLEKVRLLYGFQSVPTPLFGTNLNKIRILKEKYPLLKVGFMDHSDGSEDEALQLPLVAFGAGMDFIEKHITLDHKLSIIDHTSGLTPTKFSEFVLLMRSFEEVFGSESLELTDLEIQYRLGALKQVVACSDISEGQTISASDVTLKRTNRENDDQSIFRIEEVVGKRATQDISTDKEIHRGLI